MGLPTVSEKAPDGLDGLLPSESEMVRVGGDLRDTCLNHSFHKEGR